MPVSAEAPTRPRRLVMLEHDPVERAPTIPVRLGSLLAVCGLTGGAGTTTLAYLVALAAAQQWTELVLVADTGGPSGGLAARARLEASRSLPELASDLAGGRPLRGGVYATGPAGVRVLATGPEFTSTRAYEEVTSLLVHAREAHGLTVVDCGTLGREVDQVAAATATHAAWVLPATPYGVARGRRVLEAAPYRAGKELVIGRRDVRESRASLRELRRVAADRHAPLVLMPDLPGLDAGTLTGAAEAAQVPVQAILGALER